MAFCIEKVERLQLNTQAKQTDKQVVRTLVRLSVFMTGDLRPIFIICRTFPPVRSASWFGYSPGTIWYTHYGEKNVCNIEKGWSVSFN